MQSAVAMGMPDIATAIKSQHDMQVQSINAQRSFDAKKAYDDASAVATARRELHCKS